MKHLTTVPPRLRLRHGHHPSPSYLDPSTIFNHGASVWQPLIQIVPGRLPRGVRATLLVVFDSCLKRCAAVPEPDDPRRRQRARGPVVARTISTARLWGGQTAGTGVLASYVDTLVVAADGVGYFTTAAGCAGIGCRCRAGEPEQSGGRLCGRGGGITRGRLTVVVEEWCLGGHGNPRGFDFPFVLKKNSRKNCNGELG